MQAPQLIDPQQPLEVTLAAQEWQFVISTLRELPHRVVDDLIRKLQMQLQARADSVQLGGIPQMPEFHPKPNGSAEEHP